MGTGLLADSSSLYRTLTRPESALPTPSEFWALLPPLALGSLSHSGRGERDPMGYIPTAPLP